MPVRLFTPTGKDGALLNYPFIGKNRVTRAVSPGAPQGTLAGHWRMEELAAVAGGAAFASWPAYVGPNLVQPTAGLQPTKVLNVINGQPEVRCDGVNDWMNCTLDLSGTNAITIAWVGCQIAGGEAAMFHHNNGAVAQGGFAVWPNSTGGNIYELLNNGDGGQNWKNMSPFNPGVRRMYIVAFDRSKAAANEINARCNRAAATFVNNSLGENTSNFANAEFVLGARGGAHDLNGNVGVSELLVWKHNILDSAAELAQLENYLGTRYAL